VGPEGSIYVGLPSAYYGEIPVRGFGSGRGDGRLEGNVLTAAVIMYPTYGIKDVERSFKMDVANTVILFLISWYLGCTGRLG
jgi:hypothetical protein